jgi:alcohol dehydrogenase class IV
VPTTAGTGAEATRNSVLAVPSHNVKVSMRSSLMLPALAVVDPVLTWSMPPAITAATGLDALTQLIEAYVCKRANPLTKCLCTEGIKRAGRSLEKAYQNGRDSAAREDMAMAGLLGGISLANAGLGAVHGFAGPLGGMLGAAHGLLCAALLVPVTETNLKALEQREPDSPALDRYGRLAELLIGLAGARPEEGIARLAGLCDSLGIPGLAELGLEQTLVPAAISKTTHSSIIHPKPDNNTDKELAGILHRAMRK